MAAGTDELVRVDVEEGVATFTLNQPHKRNAMNLAMAAELEASCRRAASDPQIRVVLLRGEGGNFCSGGDLTGAGGQGIEPAPSIAASSLALVRNIYGNAVLALHGLAKPTLAVVEGVAAGAGVNFALACDLVYAADTARFAELFVKRALSIDCGGTWLLPRIVGLQKAKELALFGEWVDAHEAERMGLVTRVVPEAELAEFALGRARTLAGNAPVAMSLIKQSLNRSFDLSMADALEGEANAQAICTATNDFAEGMTAFVEKRPPRFTGG
jgi:2-(1,2-epoxy-1,2-dihydrophenyl)acetyl-CoA isomerase